MRTSGLNLLLIAAVVMTGASFCAGQANYVENFDDVTPTGTAYGPHELIARGWDFRMQSSPAHNLGFGAAFQGYPWGGSQSGPDLNTPRNRRETRVFHFRAAANPAANGVVLAPPRPR